MRRHGWSIRLAAPALVAGLALSFWLSPWASWPEPSSVSEAEASSASGASPSSGNELERLLAISKRLGELNERLRIELEASKTSSLGLAASLESSTRELEGLRRELETLRMSSTELALRAESSARASIELSTALRRADDSLRSLEVSFAAYRRAAEARQGLLGLGALGAGLLALAGWSLALGFWLAK